MYSSTVLGPFISAFLAPIGIGSQMLMGIEVQRAKLHQPGTARVDAVKLKDIIGSLPPVGHDFAHSTGFSKSISWLITRCRN